ncbi:hypothetical protein DPMN_003112 [Dreissena polymorpha]|uniref:Uncharacterized protein n=1 Tax=Dreissena polymorpha TaxID=45954 RepID=A0A9D4RUF7_DREPO|nr:hypothetical protein DPMN_003112 [Dreissena polymorpha]
MVDHVPDHVPPWFLMVDNQIPWSTIKNHGDHGLPWSSFRLGSPCCDLAQGMSELI